MLQSVDLRKAVSGGALCFSERQLFKSPVACSVQFPDRNFMSNFGRFNRSSSAMLKSMDPRNSIGGGVLYFSERQLSKSPVACSVQIPDEKFMSNFKLFSKVLDPAALVNLSSKSLQYPSGSLGGVPDYKVSEGLLTGNEYVTNILHSSVYDVAIETPLELATLQSERLGVRIWMKREDYQPEPTRSFKLRGAYSMLARLPKDQLENGVICSPAGKYAQGVAVSARELGCDAVVVMPATTPEKKWKEVQGLGAKVVLFGDTHDDAQAYAVDMAKKEGLTFVAPFDNPDVIVGQGTVGAEIVRQMRDPLYAIFVPVGSGELIAGIAAYVKRVSPEIKIIGVEPSDANAMALSLHHSLRVKLDEGGIFEDDDVAAQVVGKETFRICRELLDGVVLVGGDAIYTSMKDMFEENRKVAEPAGALAFAGAKAFCKFYNLKDINVVVITSEPNIDLARLSMLKELFRVG